MAEEQHITDENLRLVLSTDQEEWLAGKINESRSYIRAMVVFIVLCTAWVSADFSGAFLQFDAPECFSSTGDGADRQQLRKEFLAQGLVPCPKEGAGDEGETWKSIRAITTLISMLVLLVSTLTLIRSIYQLRQFKGYQTDHRAFLKKYNRL